MKKTAPTSTSPAPRRRKKAEATPAAAPSARKKMPAKVFVKIWENRMNNVTGAEWREWVAYDTFQGARRAKLSNVEVEGKIRVEGVSGSGSIHLLLSNCYLPDCEIINNAKIRSVTIQENSTTRDFRIENSTTEDFKIVDSTTGKFIVKSSTTKQFEIINSTTRGFSIKKSKTDYFAIDDTTNGEFLLQDSDATVLQISGNSTLSEVFVHHSSLMGIEINSGSFVNHLQCRFNLKEPVRLLLDRSIFGHIDFNKSVFAEFTTLNLSECRVNRLTLSNHCNYGTAFFSGLKPFEEWEDFKKDENNRLVFEDGEFQFETITHLSTLRLTDSDLGKMQFINCDLRQFQRFEFSNTKMLDVFVAGSQMPSDKDFYLPNNEKNPLKMAEQKRLAYGQFKKIYEARGDVAGALPYLAYELEAYRQQLQMEGWWKHRGELFMLWMNKLSTNYGVSWQRGLIVTVVVMIFFYSIFCYLIGYRFENNSPDDVQRFWKLVSYAPYYLNPLRDLDSISLVKEEEFTPIARIWDFVSRIFVAYFVYQTNNQPAHAPLQRHHHH